MLDSFIKRNENWVQSTCFMNNLSRQIHNYEIFAQDNRLVRFYVINGKIYSSSLVGRVISPTFNRFYDWDNQWKTAFNRDVYPEAEVFWDLLDDLEFLGYVETLERKHPYRKKKAITDIQKRVSRDTYRYVVDHDLIYETDLEIFRE